ncbi:Uncharacterised protein [Weissella viridescens]|uniref:Uncharacterized protein n=1 Tax=Weissella viridescens TaxID=1629 RepID=A0A380NXN9_WEIVI|nr:Uncharacterised protein [Weissella viridescens]
MAYKMEPGRVIHTNDYDEVDSEIVFKAPDGENAFEIVSAYFTPGTRTQKIQNTMMQMVMDSMRANLSDVVQRVLGKPYQLRGNRPETGFDVGGLIQYIYNIYGVSFSNDVKNNWQVYSICH